MITQVVLQIARSTKNTHLYKELDEQGRPIDNVRDGKIGSIYLKKNLFQGAAPDKVRVTVEEV